MNKANALLAHELAHLEKTWERQMLKAISACKKDLNAEEVVDLVIGMSQVKLELLKLMINHQPKKEST